MKTLSHPRDQHQILRRLKSIRPDTLRKWGKMSAHQMICHLSDGFRMYMGETPVAPAGRKLPGAVKFIALRAPLPWPHGFQTVPEIDQEVNGTPPFVFDADVEDLHTLIERFTRRPADFTYQTHPHFGSLSQKEWMRLAYLHTEHHLRQFGA
jgi:Protein of unknown function (DUF1569)